jgi:hypothetical protein
MTPCVPGNVADAFGDIWVREGQVAGAGVLRVSREQALFALAYGWAVREDLGDGSVAIGRAQRPDVPGVYP